MVELAGPRAYVSLSAYAGLKHYTTEYWWITYTILCDEYGNAILENKLESNTTIFT